MSVGVHASVGSGGASGSVTTAGVTTTSGSTVILLVAVNSATFGATPVQDSKSNTWTQVSTAVSIGASPDTETRVYKAVNITGGSGHTFTVNPASGGFAVLLAVECLNTPASPTVTADRQADASSPYTSPSIAPGTPVTLIGGIITDAPSGTEVDTWGGSFASGRQGRRSRRREHERHGLDCRCCQGRGNVQLVGHRLGRHGHPHGVWIVAVEENGGAAAADAYLSMPPLAPARR
jgi:hypothetical protein